MDPQTALYLRYYTQQAGGTLPAYSGARRGQYGAGLGDILRGIFRAVFPIAIRGASTFLGETLKARDEGSNWKNAALAALPSTAHNIATDAAQRLKSAPASAPENAAAGPSQQTGGRGRSAYKRPRSSANRRSSKKIKFINF